MKPEHSLPLVTVRTLVYNNGKFIIETLESVKNQTYPRERIQHIIVDDCSKDDSVEIVERWIKDNDYKCHFIKHDKNWGVCKTINQTLDISEGEYICGTGDDIWMPEKIERQVNFFLNSNEKTGVVYSDAYLMREDGSPGYGWFIQMHRLFQKIPEGNLYEVLLEGNFIPAMTAMVKRSVFDKVGYYDENLAYEDHDMWLRIAQEYEFKFSDYVSAKYRLHEKNLHKKLSHNWELEALKIYSKHSEQPLAQEKIRKIIWLLYTSDKIFEKETYRKVQNLLYLLDKTRRLIIKGRIRYKFINLAKAITKIFYPLQ